MKHFAFLLLAVISIGCTSSSGTKVQSKDSDSSDVVTTYDDPTSGIRFIYPGNWQEKSIPFLMRPKGTIIVLEGPATEEGVKLPPTFSIVAREVPANGQLDALQKQLIDRAKSQINDFKLIQSAPTQLAGVPARRIIYSGSKMGISMQTMNIIALHAGKQFGIAYSADPQMFAAASQAVQRMIESVQFAK